MAKVVVVGSLPESLINFRGEMLKEMVSLGHEVYALSPEADPELIASLNNIGVKHKAISLCRTSVNPFRDIITVIQLIVILKRLAPQYFLAYTIKPVIYGGIAARIARVQSVYAMITGLGYAFTGTGVRSKFIGLLVRGLYRHALCRANRIFFQNPESIDTFISNNIIKDREQAVLIDGSGVDLERFSPAEFPTELSFLMISRLLRDKGVVEYVDAAREIKKKYPKIKFHLVGWIDDSPASISKDELDSWIGEGVIEYWGKQEDVRPAIASSSVFCLPSYYPEGIPRTLLEALSMGRPVITTDMPGCRATVKSESNGFLVRPRSPSDLRDAMMRFVLNPDLAVAMGNESRYLAESKFDVRKINRVIIKTMGLDREETA